MSCQKNRIFREPPEREKRSGKKYQGIHIHLSLYQYLVFPVEESISVCVVSPALLTEVPAPEITPEVPLATFSEFSATR